MNQKTPPFSIYEKYAYMALRAFLGIIFITHGAARLFYWSVPEFGNFLNSQGFMIGTLIAWIITVGEVTCGSLLAIGIKVRYCVIFHAVIIATGILLVHIPQGWFVVGHGSGGVEYSLLILAVLAFIYSRSKSESITLTVPEN